MPFLLSLVRVQLHKQNDTHLILFLTKEGGEEKPSKRVLSSFNMVPHGRPNANVSLERSHSFPGWAYGYSSVEEDIDKTGPSSVRSVPLTRHSPHLVLDFGSDAAIRRPFIFEIPKSRSDSSSLQEVNQNQANNGKCPFFYLLYACSYTTQTKQWRFQKFCQKFCLRRLLKNLYNKN